MYVCTRERGSSYHACIVFTGGMTRRALPLPLPYVRAERLPGTAVVAARDDPRVLGRRRLCPTTRCAINM
jgi:hypothetical protein